MSAAIAPGPLVGIRVVELASEHAAFAGKLLADLGADVVLVEPPDGRATFGRLARTADIVLEGEPPGRLLALGVDHPDLRTADPRLVWVSVTPFGRTSPRRDEPMTDLTLLAGAGPVNLCGYDDHTLPPVRGGGNQGWHTASIWAANSALIAVLEREASGLGQHVDVSMHAAVNVTTEGGSYEYLVSGAVLERQTGRHAHDEPTTPSQHQAADGTYVHIGFTQGTPAQLHAIIDWLDQLGLRDEHPEAFWLEVGLERGGVHFSELGQDVEATAVFGAVRDALELIVVRLLAREFFLGAAERGLSVGVVLAADEVLTDPHFVAREFPVAVDHPALGRAVTYPGAPFKLSATPWRISRGAPTSANTIPKSSGPCSATTRVRVMGAQHRASTSKGASARAAHERLGRGSSRDRASASRRGTFRIGFGARRGERHMATVKHVEAKVWRVERFRARLHYEQPGRRQGRDVRSDRGQLPPYPYVRAARADSTVAEWIAKRFEGTYPGLTAEVLNGQGHVVHGRTKLETVRRSYS